MSAGLGPFDTNTNRQRAFRRLPDHGLLESLIVDDRSHSRSLIAALTCAESY